MDRESFEKLALAHLDSVYRLALQLCRQPDKAADLVQDTYLKALKAADRYEEKGGGIRPWLFKILRNVFYTRLLKDQRQPIPNEAVLGLSVTDDQPDEPSPAWNLACFDWEHVDQRLKHAIEGLNPEYREVLLLWGVEGMKYREIALILEVPIGTVMSRLFRARSILGEQLGSVAGDMGWRMVPSAGVAPETVEDPTNRLLDPPSSLGHTGGPALGGIKE